MSAELENQTAYELVLPLKQEFAEVAVRDMQNPRLSPLVDILALHGASMRQLSDFMQAYKAAASASEGVCTDSWFIFRDSGGREHDTNMAGGLVRPNQFIVSLSSYEDLTGLRDRLMNGEEYSRFFDGHILSRSRPKYYGI